MKEDLALEDGGGDADSMSVIPRRECRVNQRSIVASQNCTRLPIRRCGICRRSTRRRIAFSVRPSLRATSATFSRRIGRLDDSVRVSNRGPANGEHDIETLFPRSRRDVP